MGTACSLLLVNKLFFVFLIHLASPVDTSLTLLNSALKRLAAEPKASPMHNSRYTEHFKGYTDLERLIILQALRLPQGETGSRILSYHRPTS